MSTDYSAQRFDTIAPSIIGKVCPEAFDLFNLEVDRVAVEAPAHDSGLVFMIFAREEQGGEEPEDRSYDINDVAGNGLSMTKVEKAYKALRIAFRKATKLGLRAGFCGEGLRGSDLSEEAFWYLTNATVPNPDLLTLMKAHDGAISQQWFMDAG